MASTLVYCVRHGQTAENLRGIIQGQLDTLLDETGIEQAAAVARALKDITFNAGWSSDLARAVDTTDAILQNHPGVELCKTALLRERNMGNLQGQAAFTGRRRPPLDESVEASSVFMERALQFWDQMILPHVKLTAKAKNERSPCVLVVSHGAFLGTLVRSLIGHRNVAKAPEVSVSWCPNASITLVEVGADGTGTLRSFGDVSHLTKPGVVGNVDELPALR